MRKLILTALILMLAGLSMGAVYTWQGYGSKIVWEWNGQGVNPISQYDTFSVDNYYTGDLDSMFLLSDSAGVSWVESIDTFNFVPGDTASFVIADTLVRKVKEITVSTTGTVKIDVNHSSATAYYLGSDMILTLPEPKNQIRLLHFTAIDTARVIASGINDKFSD